MTLQGLIIVLFAMSLAFVTYLYVDYKETGGYDRNSNAYYGYLYPSTNGFKKVEDCNRANTENPHVPPVTKEWMDGCKKYFEVNN